jgi:hypothetical protein
VQVWYQLVKVARPALRAAGANGFFAPLLVAHLSRTGAEQRARAAAARQLLPRRLTSRLLDHPLLITPKVRCVAQQPFIVASPRLQINVT